MNPTAILLINCPDQKGINAAVADFIFRNNGNIVHADEHQDAEEKLFLMRVEWELEGFAVATADFERQFAPLADRFKMQWRLALSSYKPRAAIFVSQHDHCLVDLLYRHRAGELPCEIPLVVSNHADARRELGMGALQLAVGRLQRLEQCRLQAVTGVVIKLLVGIAERCHGFCEIANRRSGVVQDLRAAFFSGVSHRL